MMYYYCYIDKMQWIEDAFFSKALLDACVLQGNIHPSSGILIKVPDDAAIEAPKR